MQKHSERGEDTGHLLTVLSPFSIPTRSLNSNEAMRKEDYGNISQDKFRYLM